MSRYEHRLQQIFDGATLLAALTTPVLVVALALDPPAAARHALTVANWLCWGVFVAEAVVMLTVSHDRWGWLQRRPLSPVLAVLTPPALGGLDLVRMLRLLRGRTGRRAAEAAVSDDGVRYVAILTLLTVGFGGLLFARIEPNTSVGDALYWAVTTVTTTGYGDIVPTTGATKALAVYVMIVGAGFLAILTGAIAQRFIQGWRAAHQHHERVDDSAMLAKLDEISERLAAVERAVDRR